MPTSASKSNMPSQRDFAPVRADIVKLLHQPEYDDGSAGPVLVRLAWYFLIHLPPSATSKSADPLIDRHSSGTYDAQTDTGGSNGAGMRYEAEGGDPANAGLQHARVFLEPVKKKHSWVTYSDLWTLAGVVAIKEMGGPDINWQPGYAHFALLQPCNASVPKQNHSSRPAGAPTTSTTANCPRAAASPTPPRAPTTSATSSTAWASPTARLSP